MKEKKPIDERRGRDIGPAPSLTPPRRAGEGKIGNAADTKASGSRKQLSDEDWDKLARAPRRWPKRLAVFLILVAAVIAALPTVIGKTPLRNVILSAMLPKVLPNGGVQVAIGDASLGWFSPPSVSGIEVRDAAGRPLVAVESVQLSRSPWSLAANWHDLGEIEITRPVVYVAVRPDGSNVEDVINELVSKGATNPTAMSQSPEGADGSGGGSVGKAAVAVKVVDGTVLVQEAATGRGWRLASLNAQYDSHGAGAGIGQVAASGQITTEAVATGGTANSAMMSPGKFAFSLATDASGRQQAQWQAESISLAAAEPWLRRFAVGAEVSGMLSGQGSAAWSTSAMAAAGSSAKPPADLVTSGIVRIDRLDACGPQLKGDRVRLATVELPWRLSAQPSGVTIDDLELKSDVGHVAARGVISPTLISAAAIAGATGAVPLDAAAKQNLEVRGDLDLAKLAAMLPHALWIREGTTINSGTIQLAIRNQPIDGGQSLTGQIRTEKLAGTSGGKPLSWDQPVNATFELRRENGNLRLNSLKCDSEFLKVDAAGTLDELTASAEFDLNKLSSQLGQFVDLSGMQLAGTGTAHLDCHLAEANQFTASANSELLQLRMAMGGEAPLSEPRLSLKAEAAGVLDPASHVPARVATARLQIDADNDQLDAQLAEPVDCTTTPTWPLSIRLTGSIAHWLTLARPWMATDPWQVDGQSQATADVRAGGETVDVSNAKATIMNLHVVGVGWNIAEPRVELAADLHWNLKTNEIASQSAQVVSSAVAVATKDVHVKTGGPGPVQMTGVAAFRGDVSRLASWQVPPSQPAPYQPQGSFNGNVRVVQQGDRITGEMAVTGQDLMLAQWMAAGSGAGAAAAGYQTIWQEPQASIKGTTMYDGAADKLTFQQLQVQSNTLQAAADGQIDRLTTLTDVTAAGTLNYDLAQITPLLKPYVGDRVQLGGRETARFQIAGRMGGISDFGFRNADFQAPAAGVSPQSAVHWSRRLQARVEVPWESANVYGLPIGGGKIAAALGEGALRIDPLALAVAEGQLNASPNVQFDPEPMLLTLPKGPVLTNVKISQEVSEAMLKYIAPVLAGATQSEGQFSLQLDGARVPLLDTKKADAAGQLTMHSVRVVPGPMAKQWVDLGQQIQSLVKRKDAAASDPARQVTLLTVQDQQVNFRVADGRVYHQGMEFQIGDMTCHSDGSVGLDETVAITLRIAIPDKWVEGQPLLAGFKGQSLSIPIGGTLNRPQMDQRAVASLSRQLLQGAAQQAVGGELNKALDKFFKAK
jgi:translocation and assembly module TamB